MIKEQPAEIDDLGAINVQGHNRSASCRGQADNLRIVGSPGEMIGPPLLARMEQRNEFMCYGITRFELGVFVIVAALARQREIRRGCSAAAMFGNDVLDRKRLRRVTRLAEAVLTATVCAGDCETAQFCAGAGLRHNPVEAA